MVTRRNFLTANLTAAALSILGNHQTMAGEIETERKVSDPPGSDRDFWNDWPNSMTRKMNQARESRRQLLATIQSTSHMEERNTVVRKSLWDLLGGRPEETPLNPRVTGTVERKEYRIEKLIFESMPQVYVTANLYVPTASKPPFPAILAPIGHSPNGKAALRYQYTYQNLARKGYVVLTWDPFGQGERIQYLQSGTNHTRFHAVSMEHTQAGRPMVLFGDGLAKYLAWDGIRGLDYLLTRSEVDSQRIGCTGQSGGGTMTMFLAALEPRIHAAVAIEGAFANVAGPYYDPPGAISDAETDLVGSLPLQIDRGDLLAAFAPKPLLVCYTRNDEGQTYGPMNSEAIQDNYNDLSRIYGIYGATDKVSLFAGDLPHGMDFFARQAIYGWFNRWFDKLDAGVQEAEYDAAPDSLLNVTSTGQVSTSIGGRSIVQLNADRATTLLPPSPFANRNVTPSNAAKTVRQQLANLLALPAERTPLHSRNLSTNRTTRRKIEEIQIESEPGVRIVGWFIAPLNGVEHPCVLYVSNGNADEIVVEPGPFDGLLRAGHAVCAVAVRGTGLSTPRPPRGGPVFYQQMDLLERFAWTNLILGTSAMGQRVWDTLQTVQYLATRRDVNASQIRMIGQEEAGLAALMASALDDRVRSVLLNRVLVSYMSLAKSKDYSLALDWFVPGILRHFDLPDIVASVSSNSVWIVDSIGASGALLRCEDVRAMYAQHLGDRSEIVSKLHFLNSANQMKADYLTWVETT